MPKMPTPIDADPEIAEKFRMYQDCSIVDKEKFPYAELPNPQTNPVPDVEYDDSGLPILPPDITKLGSRQLGQLFQAVEAWHAFFSFQASDADLDKLIKKESSDLVKAHVIQELRRGKDGVPGMSYDHAKEFYKLDMRFIVADTAYLKARVISEKLDVYRSTVSRRFMLISREITRRGEDTSHFAGSNNPDGRFRGDRGYGEKADENRFGNRKL